MTLLRLVDESEDKLWQFGPEAPSATFFLSATHIPVKRLIQLRLIPSDNGHVLCICRRLIDALTVPLISALSLLAQVIISSIEKLREITMVEHAANTFTKDNFNRCLGGKSEIVSVCESLWNFKVHGKLRLKHQIHKLSFSV